MWNPGPFSDRDDFVIKTWREGSGSQTEPLIQ